MEDIELIWKNFHTRLKSFIISRVQDAALADDILQEVFIKAHTYIDSLREGDKIVPWVFQITRNQIMDHFRSQKKIRTALINQSEPGDDLNDLSSTMNTAIKDMIGMLDNLSPEYCEALCAIELDGISQISYAKYTGIPYSTVKSRVQRARLQLKDMMMKCCHYQFDKYGTVLGIRPAQCCCCSAEIK